MPNLATLTAEGWSVPPIPSRRPIILAQSAIAASVTGTLVETVLATINIPGGIMGANGAIRVIPIWSYPSSANNKTLRVKFGATAFYDVVVTANVSAQALIVIRNRNSQASQVGFAPQSGTGVGGSTSPIVTAALDTSVDQYITITGQLALAGENITLEGYTVEVLPG